jgi:hypothetical protein
MRAVNWGRHACGVCGQTRLASLSPPRQPTSYACCCSCLMRAAWSAAGEGGSCCCCCCGGEAACSRSGGGGTVRARVERADPPPGCPLRRLSPGKRCLCCCPCCAHESVQQSWGRSLGFCVAVDALAAASLLLLKVSSCRWCAVNELRTGRLWSRLWGAEWFQKPQAAASAM